MAEEDEGMEAFDFDERDLEFALNPGGRRHFQTKNQATYGGVRPPLLNSSAIFVKNHPFIENCCFIYYPVFTVHHVFHNVSFRFRYLGRSRGE